ncbi:AlpA family phage regulatory protein [Alcaligenes sp. NLF5-7]|uniref:helix-turn-helix transcriptional regulator n=1 Tax=Alcaligenes sp. NLF5-7 TaxID=2918755 RepID=UPI0020C24340|nr:AlpA family phage regulatory protein [Alcaligenes sp. NLF5-7]UTM02913.1 AlpA family phage regulatory protein [Alcaligenes sp. NLF5-7]
MTEKPIENLFLSKIPLQSSVPLLEDQFVDMKFITKFTTMSDKWFYKLINEGRFPSPVKLGRRSLWLKSEVEDWLLQRILSSRGCLRSEIG